MQPEVIDLLSSDAGSEIPSSSAPAAVETTTANRPFIDLSDEVDFLPTPKRRRLTPSPPRRRPLGDGTQRVNRNNGPNLLQIPVEDSNPVICGSSPALPPFKQQVNPAAGELQSALNDSFISSGRLSSSPKLEPSASMNFSSRTTTLLAELDGNRLAGRRLEANGNANSPEPDEQTSVLKFAPPGKKIGRPKKTARAPLSSIEEFSSQPIPPRVNALVSETAGRQKAQRPRATTAEREEQARNKAEERQVAKAQKAAAKEAKAREKQLAADLAEVNKARHDKKISVAEMIVQLPESMRCGPNTRRLAEETLMQLGVQLETVDNWQGTGSGSADEGDLITWKRKVRARFDEEAGHWIPLDRMEVRSEESHVLCVLDARHFMRMAQRDLPDSGTGDLEADGASSTTDGRRNGLSAHVRAIKCKYSNRKVIYLIEGLETLMRKSRNARNRSYQAAARAQERSETGSRPTKRKPKKDEDLLVDEDTIEDALLELQITHCCLIHHTTAAPETAEWVANFTQHISTIPYKTQQSTAEASFCMDVGQVKTGDDKDDTFVKMLQEIVRVTLPVAYGITARYPSVVSLFNALKSHGPLLLQDLKKCSNKNGGFTDARIGPALSRRVYKIFMGEDPDSTDV